MHEKRQQRREAFESVDIYPVTCRTLSVGRSDDEVLGAIIAGGARIVQLRDKEASKRELYDKAVRFRTVTGAAGILLIVNDHIDIAMAIDADGVHLGQDDLPVPVARQLAPDKLIGASSHSRAEAAAAEAEGADYVNIGPIFATRTKANATQFVGVDMIREIAPNLSIPFTVMGGIKLENLEDVLAAGARRVAVVTAITQADDMAAATAHFRRRIRAAE